jgi:hypothetical protein
VRKLFDKMEDDCKQNETIKKKKGNVRQSSHVTNTVTPSLLKNFTVTQPLYRNFLSFVETEGPALHS